MEVSFLKQQFELNGPYLDGQLRDSSLLLDSPVELRQRLIDDGYLYLPQLQNRQLVLAARRIILQSLANRGLLMPGSELEDALYNSSIETATTSAMSNDQLSQLACISDIVGSDCLLSFFKSLFECDVTSFDYRWLRTAGTGASSAIHCDNVFMGRGSQRFLTCWTPLCDVSLDMGPLVLCPGSHQIDAIARYYGQSDVDQDLIAGHFAEDPTELLDQFSCRWATSEFRAGDVVVFHRHLLHASLVNSSPTLRISIDTRYQPATDPIDERWVGKNPMGHYAWKAPDAVIEPLAVSRKRWALQNRTTVRNKRSSD